MFTILCIDGQKCHYVGGSYRAETKTGEAKFGGDDRLSPHTLLPRCLKNWKKKKRKSKVV